MKPNKFVDRVNPFKIIKKKAPGKFDQGAEKFIDTDISGFKVVKPGKTDKPKDQAENE